MESESTTRVYNLKLWQENGVIGPPDIKRDDLILMKFIYPILWNLSLIGISQKDVKNYVGLFKMYSQKGKKGPKSNTRMLIREHFTTIFQYLCEKIGKPKLFIKRNFDRMKNYERNIFFTYFAAQFPTYMYQIANNFFNDFAFKEKLYQKEELSSNFKKLTDEVQELKKSNNLIINFDVADSFPFEENSFSEDDQFNANYRFDLDFDDEELVNCNNDEFTYI